MKRSLLYLAAIAACIPGCEPAYGQGATGDWKTNAVHHTATAPAAPDAEIRAALADVPADDSGKWHVNLFVSKPCAACDRLKKDFAASPKLRALADQSRTAWAHLHLFDLTDPQQKWRFSDWDITQTPVIIITPPPNSRTWPYYAAARRTGYNGDPDRLADDLVAAISQFARRFHPNAPQPNQTPTDRDDPPPPANDPPPAAPGLRPGPLLLPDFPPQLRPADDRRTETPKAGAPPLELILVLAQPNTLRDRIEQRAIARRLEELHERGVAEIALTTTTLARLGPTPGITANDLPAVILRRDGQTVALLSTGALFSLLDNVHRRDRTNPIGPLLAPMVPDPNTPDPDSRRITIDARPILDGAKQLFALTLAAAAGVAAAAWYIRRRTRTTATAAPTKS